jgi:RNA polymerase sigma factor (sigma-70 family)
LGQELPERFQTVFREHYPSVLYKLVHLVKDRMVAEDLAQEAFLRLYRQPPDDIRSVGAWLHRVATRIAYDYMRQRSAIKRTEERELSVNHVETAGPPSDVVVMRNYDREAVKRVLQQLSERDRQVLLLRYSGYTYAEIADIIGVNAEIVGTILRRALGRFKRRYHGQEGTSDEGTWIQGQHLV